MLGTLLPRSSGLFRWPTDGEQDYDFGYFDLRFHTSEKEAAFASERQPRLLVNSTSMGTLFCSITTMNIVISTFIPPPEGTWDPRVVYWSNIGWTTKMVIVFLWTCLMHIQYTACFFPMYVREAVTVSIFGVFMAVAIVIDYRYLSHVFGRDENWHCTNAKTGLLLCAYILSAHIAIPIRWCYIQLLDIAAIMSWMVSCLFLEDKPGDYIFEMCLFISIVLASALGSRSREVEDRLRFATVVRERTLRATAEFQAGNKKGRNEERLWPETSVDQRTTTKTEALFEDVHREARIDPHVAPALIGNAASSSGNRERWEKIRALGRDEHWLIKEEELNVDRQAILGSGSFAVVVAGRFCWMPVAVKIPKTMKDVSSVSNELRVIRQVRHPNIVLFYGASVNVESGKILLVLERLQGQTLHEFIYTTDTTFETKMDIMVGVGSALLYLHSRTPGIVHCDLKASNIMVKASGRPLLLDFGLSRLMTGTARPIGGSIRYAAPEILVNGTQRPKANVDIFSFGRVLYHVAYGRKPLAHLTPPQILEMAQNKEVPELEWGNQRGLDKLRSLVMRCVEVDPHSRPATEVVFRELCALPMRGRRRLVRTTEWSPSSSSSMSSSFSPGSAEQTFRAVGEPRAAASGSAGEPRADSGSPGHSGPPKRGEDSVRDVRRVGSRGRRGQPVAEDEALSGAKGFRSHSVGSSDSSLPSRHSNDSYSGPQGSKGDPLSGEGPHTDPAFIEATVYEIAGPEFFTSRAAMRARRQQAAQSAREDHIIGL